MSGVVGWGVVVTGVGNTSFEVPERGGSPEFRLLSFL